MLHPCYSVTTTDTALCTNPGFPKAMLDRQDGRTPGRYRRSVSGDGVVDAREDGCGEIELISFLLGFRTVGFSKRDSDDVLGSFFADDIALVSSFCSN